MIVEVVAIGTELLLGQITNRNGSTIGAMLADDGFDAHYQVVVGDNLPRMVETISAAMGRSDAVIITGGIGPTQDDVTREAISEATGRLLMRNDDYVQELRERFSSFDREMPENNARQAEYPKGGEQLPNPKGTAPGLLLEHDGTMVFALPGVPAEMALLMTDHVMPRLRARAGVASVLVSRVIRSWGRSESQVAEILDNLFQASTNPSVAFLASEGEIKVRLSAKAETVQQAEELIKPAESKVRELLGLSIFATDTETIGSVLLRSLSERGWTIGTAESATAGSIGSMLTAIPGMSKVFRGGIIAYATDVKTGLLGVDNAVIEAHGVVSEATAIAMADAAAETLGVDVVISVTGSAGPDPQEREVGTIIIGVRTPEGTRARVLKLPGDRERVRTYATTAGLHLARLAIEGHWWA
jgi:nicotinamide-nucleotide amidase